MFTVTVSCWKIQLGHVETSEALKVNIFRFINKHLVNARRLFFTFPVDTLLKPSGKQYIIDNSCIVKCFVLYQGSVYLWFVYVTSYVKWQRTKAAEYFCIYLRLKCFMFRQDCLRWISRHNRKKWPEFLALTKQGGKAHSQPLSQPLLNLIIVFSKQQQSHRVKLSVLLINLWLLHRVWWTALPPSHQTHRQKWIHF